MPVPDRPRLVIRVGVTGHRAERLVALAREADVDPDAYEARLADVLTSVLDAIEVECIALRSKPGSRFSEDRPLINVLIGAAFGVDRIAANLMSERRVRSVGTAPDQVAAEWRLEAVLPAPLALTAEAALSDSAWTLPDRGTGPDEVTPAYMAEWDGFLAQCDSVTILPASWRAAEGAARKRLKPDATLGPGDRPTGDYRISYVAAADFQLEQSDLLIAVWDGRPSRGPGGVADIVTHAHTAAMPVVVVDAARSDRPPAMLQSIVFGPERPNIVGWAPEPLEAIVEAADSRDEAIADALRSVLELREDDDATGASHAGTCLIDEFLKENHQRRKPLGVYEEFVRWFGDKRLRPARRRASEGRRDDRGWSGWAETVKDREALSDDLAILRRRYSAASKLANDYASRYRSTFVSAFTLGATAGGFAVVGQAFAIEHFAVKAALIVAELLAIGVIVLLVRTGRRHRYHAKYVEYRTLAESLYALRFLGAFGEALSLRGTGAERWTDWYARCTARELELPNQPLDATYQRRLLKAVCEYEIAPQIAYHERNERLMESVEHRIHLLGNLLFFSVFLSLVVLFALWTAHSFTDAMSVVEADVVKPALNFVSAFFPAAGAALAGIRFMADFDGRAVRSREMVAALRNLGARAETAQQSQQFSTTREILRDLAATLSKDVKLFHASFSRRELALPG